MRWAVIAALAVHAMLLFVPAGCPNSGTHFLPAPPEQQPLVVTLRPPEEPKALIDPGAPAEVPVNPDTNLIAEHDSKAQDMSPADNGGITPDAGAVGDSDQIAPPRTPTPQPPAPPAPVPAAPAPQKEPVAETKPEARPLPKPRENPAPPVRMEAVEKAVAEQPKEPDEQLPQDAAIVVAKADAPPVPERTVGKSQSKVEGGVKSKGFLSYEAMQSDFAPYLRHIRDRVEKRWKALIQVRYSGNSSTEAVVDCAIAPDGRLAGVTIVEAGDSATFAGLCQQAIEQAGPFGAFPFAVPEMYRNQNIEIRWTFSFL